MLVSLEESFVVSVLNLFCFCSFIFILFLALVNAVALLDAPVWLLARILGPQNAVFLAVLASDEATLLLPCKLVKALSWLLFAELIEFIEDGAGGNRF